MFVFVVSGLALCVWCTFSSFMSPSSCTMSSLLLSWRDDILCSSSSFLCLKHTQTQSLDRSYMQWVLREWGLLDPNPKSNPSFRFKLQHVLGDLFLHREKRFNCPLELVFDISDIHLTYIRGNVFKNVTLQNLCSRIKHFYTILTS